MTLGYADSVFLILLLLMIVIISSSLCVLRCGFSFSMIGGNPHRSLFPVNLHMCGVGSADSWNITGDRISLKMARRPRAPVLIATAFCAM